MDWGAFFSWLLGQALKWAPSAFSFFKGGLETTKSATEAVASVKQMLVQPQDNSDKTPPEDVAERIYAVSSLTRSYAIFGFLELLLWIWKGIILYVLFTKAHELLVYQERAMREKREAKQIDAPKRKRLS